MNKIQNIAIIPEINNPAPEPDAAKDCGDLCALFEAEESRMLLYARSLVHRVEVAEELVQEVFLQLHNHRDKVRNPKSWLYRSLRNRAYNYNRDHRREVITDHTSEGSSAQIEPDPATPEQLFQRIEAAGVLRELLAQLNEDDRQIVELKYYRNLKYAEIGKQTGLSEGNIGYRLHHILKQLSEELRKLGIDSANPQTYHPS